MKKILLLLLLFLLPGLAFSQGKKMSGAVQLDEVTITAPRSIKDIGTQKTKIDSFALRENVVNSLAEVLSQNTSVFIKSYGRATLATASFRGTAASHTQVTWNGMRINSPMLGMVDFSLIPSYFIDDANLYHGATSVGVTGGGLGGAVVLGTKSTQEEGFGVRYIQGIGSFNTFDEFLKITYGSKKLNLSTRVYYASSDNDFKYTNYKKKLYEKDEEGNIIGRYHPVERNKNGFFKDFHVLQEAYYNQENGNRWSLSAWYMNSNRGLPMLSVDRRPASAHKEEQDEQTFRSALGWSRMFSDLKLDAKAGYVYTDFSYIYQGDNGEGELKTMTDSHNYTNTFYADLSAEYFIGDKWSFSGNVSLHQNKVTNRNQAIEDMAGETQIIGYNKARPELSGFLSAKYKPHQRVGIAVNLREDWYGKGSPQFIPAAFAEYYLIKDGSLIMKSSIARNYRFPTLNDLYFLPGGNPDLKPEYGFTYDVGLEYARKFNNMELKAEASFFDSYVKDWILWILERPYPRPVNIKEVRSYGGEFKGSLLWDLGKDWRLSMHGNYSITNSINRREAFSTNDMSIGKQLPYIPKYSATATGSLRWKQWEFIYKWNYYSERFTTSSNDSSSKIGTLGTFYMSDISLERNFPMKWAQIALKLTVNNLFDEEYESVLSRPMAGRHYGFFIQIAPNFGKKGKRME